MRKIWTLLLIAAFCACAVMAHSQEMASATLVPSSATLRRGEIVTVTATLTNTQPKRAPIIITAILEYEDTLGQPHTASAQASLDVIQPVKMKRWSLAIPALFDYVAGSAQVDGGPVTAAMDGSILALDLARELVEGQSAVVTAQLRAR